jgi:PPOX class probable F420-dependent enzyme
MRTRVAEAQVGRLATTTAENEPHIVPCCFALGGDVVYSAVDHKPKSTRALQRLMNLRANPHAALLVDEYHDDWSALWWVRADGLARILYDGTDFEHAITLLVAKYRQYRDDPPLGPVIALDVATWRSWP